MLEVSRTWTTDIVDLRHRASLAGSNGIPPPPSSPCSWHPTEIHSVGILIHAMAQFPGIVQAFQAVQVVQVVMEYSTGIGFVR